MDFSTFFDLGKTQAELDFVNVDPERDTRVFVDPYALEVKEDQWSNRCADHIRSFFQAVLQAIRTSDEDRAMHFLSNLHESQETFLGLSKGVPRGRGIGSGNANQLYEALLGSKAVHTGLISDLAEAELFIPGIGRDKVSDLTTNIIRGPLIDYTKKQCDLHGVPLQEAVVAGPIWLPSSENWVQRTHALPIVQGRPVILVPKYSVRRRLSLESHEFYDKHFITFLQAEYQKAAGSLARVMRAVTKKQVKEENPFSKEELADFALNNPHVLQLYRELAKSSGPMATDDLDEGFDERAFAGQLSRALQQVPTGRAHASAYHKLIIGLLSFLLFPGLIEPVKEAELHEGRKRLDIRFTNAGATPFFNRIVGAAQTRALTVPVECKNYTEDLGNPEFDQLSGRFSHTRGFFGFLCCRAIDNRDRMVAACRDTALDGRGYIVVLSDDDLMQMLTAVEMGNRNLIDGMLNRRLAELLT